MVVCNDPDNEKLGDEVDEDQVVLVKEEEERSGKTACSSSSSSSSSSSGNTCSNGKVYRCNGNPSSSVGGGLREAVVQYVSSPQLGFAFKKTDLVRLMSQTLRDLGYGESANTLEKESGVREEHELIGDLESHVMCGQWDKVLQDLRGLVLGTAENGKKLFQKCQVLLLREKFVELLEKGRVEEGLRCLQEELEPICPQTELTSLSSLFLVCDLDQIRLNLGRSSSQEKNRGELMLKLRKLLPPSLVLPKQRLLSLLEYAVHDQAMRAELDWQEESGKSVMPLVQDLNSRSFQTSSSIKVMPIQTVQILKHHDPKSQVWCVSFNPSGTMLATAGTDLTVIIYSVCYDENKTNKTNRVNDEPLLFLRGHKEPIDSVAWSPDGKVLLSADIKGHIYVWNGIGDKSLSHVRVKSHRARVTSLTWWGNDSTMFFSASFDNTIQLTKVDGTVIAHWGAAPFYDICFLPTRKCLLGSCGGTAKKRLRLFSVQEKKNGHRIKERKGDPSQFNTLENVTALNLNKTGSILVTNLGNGKLMEWDVKSGIPRKTYAGINQGKAVLRPAIGGYRDNLLACGTIDAKICLWERSDPKAAIDSPSGGIVPIKQLVGHTQVVNSVTFSPKDPTMLVSASDDSTVRVWG